MTFVKDDYLLQTGSLFNSCPASKTLRQLSYDAVDLSRPDQLTADRVARYCAESCGFKLLFGTERVTDEVLEALDELAVQTHAVEKMKRMQEGHVVNFVEHYPCENRPALHTATRDFFDNPHKGEQAKSAADLARQEIEKLQCFIAKLETEKLFDEMVLIGIGGSDLGPRAHFHALQHLLKPGHKVHFISNVDPDDAAEVLKHVNLKRALVVVVSKSGTTLETGTNEEIVRAKFKSLGIKAKERIISITMPGTPMDNRDRYFETFYVWDWIGGRYSTTSMVGGVILAFAFGFDVYWEFLRGAHEMDQAALGNHLNKNLPLLAALLEIWNRNFLNCPTTAIIPYSQPLHRYAAHLQQAGMESNGKVIDQTGKFVDFDTGGIWWGEPGTNAQHSFFQMLHQGTATVPVCFIGFKKCQIGEDLEVQGTTSQEKLLSNLFAQSLGLALGNHSENPNQFTRGNRPSHILLGEQLTPKSLGTLLSFWENKVAFIGFILGINSFDQEGVQLGKRLANQLIDRFAAHRKKTQDQAPYPIGDAYLKHLERFR